MSYLLFMQYFDLSHSVSSVVCASVEQFGASAGFGRVEYVIEL